MLSGHVIMQMIRLASCLALYLPPSPMHSLSNILKDSARNPAEWGVIRIIPRVGGEDVVNRSSESAPYLLRTIWQTRNTLLIKRVHVCIRAYIELGKGEFG